MEMAAKIHISSSFSHITNDSRNSSSSSYSSLLAFPQSLSPQSPKCFKLHAKLGGGDGEEVKSKGKKKFITKEEEPEQYWQSAGEREGENPMKTPLPYIIIFAKEEEEDVLDSYYHVVRAFKQGKKKDSR